MSKLIFLDTETTGLDTNTAGLIEVAGLIDIDGKEVAAFDIKTNIYKDDVVDESALISNGVTIEEIHNYQNPRLAFAQLVKELGKYLDQYDKKDKFIALAYVADFDNRVVRKFFQKNNNQFFGSWWRNPWLDIFNLAAYVYQDTWLEFENHKLATVAKHLGIPCDDCQTHNALYDATIARAIYYKMIE